MYKSAPICVDPSALAIVRTVYGDKRYVLREHLTADCSRTWIPLYCSTGLRMDCRLEQLHKPSACASLHRDNIATT